ncbi:hypothetical protein DV736_g3254, partial [Chaetothyriales sp. CBS 134916]
MILARSLPGGFEAAGTPPVHVDTTSTSATLTSFFKTTLLPILIALALYLLLCHILLPLYRKHRARYSQYLPLSATTSAATALTSRLPSSIHPSTIRSRVIDGLARLFLPSAWTLGHSQQRPDGGRRGSNSDSSSSTDENILTDESCEALVNFDYSNSTGTIQDQNRRRRDAMERQVARGLQAAREMGMGESDDEQLARSGRMQTSIPPERRLSRDLEEGFRDDSDDGEGQGDEDGENAVTLGRGRQAVLTAR